MKQVIFPTSSGLIEPLTRRESKILTLLAEHLSNPEIAEAETLALSSVKWYVQQVYAKLGVNSRKQAVERARDIGLLGEPPAAITPSSPLPTGTVTFLFTDIVGSTSLWEKYPDEMVAAMHIHQAALRQTIESHGGVVFNTVVDAFQAVFATALQALEAAITGQQALATAVWNELGPLPVCMGLLTGEAELDPGGDEYAISHTMNRVSRIMSAAHGGQILLSAETTELINRQLPTGVSLRDVGEHRLKGLALPEHLHQVCAPGLAQDFPALVSTIVQAHNLPIQMTSFIGREQETKAVIRLLAEHRLVTLTGSGGTGKTRLSLWVAAASLEAYPNGAWLVELAPLADPTLLPSAVASALSLPETPGKDIRDSLVDLLRSKRLLLILDNCEHLLEACARLADMLLHACPDLTILASSREFLGVEGEAPFRVPPLSLPDSRHLPPFEKLSGFDSIRLFVERAQVVSPGFALTHENATTVAQIVTRLDGIPLAIELAAARLRLLSVEQIALRLKDAFRLLTGGSRSVLPRHQTLRALIDWSYNLLSEPERILLGRLSVFAGGWDLEAAEQVCAHSYEACQPLCTEDILDHLSGLVDKSLILASPGMDGEGRFQMLETIRQYTHEKLVDGGEAGAVRTRHLAHYLWLAETLEPKIRSREQIQTLDRLELELDNLRLALEWSLQTNLEAELKLAAALMWFWHIHAHYTEGIEWLNSGLEETKRPNAGAQIHNQFSHIHAKALVALGFHQTMLYVFDADNYSALQKAKTLLEESLSIYQNIGLEYRHNHTWALLWLGSCISYDNPAQAKTMAQETLNLFRETNDRHGMAESLQLLGYCETDLKRRKMIHQEQLEIDQANGDIEGTATGFFQVGIVFYCEGDYVNSQDLFDASLRNYQRVNNVIMIARSWYMLGDIAQCKGDFERANQCFQKCLTISRESTNSGLINLSLFSHFGLAIAQARFNQAAQDIEILYDEMQKTDHPTAAGFAYYGRARLARLGGDSVTALKYAQEALNFSLNKGLIKIIAYLELGHLALQSGELAQAGSFWRKAVQSVVKAHLFEWARIVQDAILLLAVREQKHERAVRLFGTRWCIASLYHISPSERLELETELAGIKIAIGEVRYRQLEEEGAAMSLEQLLAYELEENE